MTAIEIIKWAIILGIAGGLGFGIGKIIYFLIFYSIEVFFEVIYERYEKKRREEFINRLEEIQEKINKLFKKKEENEAK